MLILLAWAAGWVSHDYLQPAVQGASKAIPPQTMSASPTRAAPVETKPHHKPSVAAAISQQNDALQAFQSALQQEQFDAAMNIWPANREQQARELVFAVSRKLQHQERNQSALRLLQRYRDQFPGDLEAGLMQAGILHQSKLFQRETFLLMAMLHTTSGSASVHQVREHMQQAIDAETLQLTQSRHDRELLNFYRRLSNQDGANQDYILMQAKILIQMADLSQATSLLQPLLFDPDMAGSAHALLDSIKARKAAHYQASIPLQRSGKHFLVPISINGNPPLYLLIDTGASITLIHHLQDPAPNNSGQAMTLQTANGIMQVPLFTATTLHLGRFDLHDVTLGVLSKPIAEHANGLLGMDILRHFNFLIDQQAPALKLSWRDDTH